jgi:LysM domain
MTKDCNLFYFVVDGDGCQIIADQKGIMLSDFYSWNPAVGPTCASLWLGNYVCVGVIGGVVVGGTTTTKPKPTTTTPSNGITTPTPIQGKMTPNCNAFDLVVENDGCETIAARNKISLSDFYTWNPAVGPTCASLWLNTYACVGVIGGGSATKTAATATATKTRGNGITTPTPIQVGRIFSQLCYLG